ncbi:MAG: hypothetical protein U0641_10045 [Anaerolineae bacterium]
MLDGERYAFTVVDAQRGATGFRPQLPLVLKHHDRTVTTSGLLDTGALVNVLPYQTGVDLGAVWEEQTVPSYLTGNLARYEARALLLEAVVGRFEQAQLIFAWTQANEVPLLLGQVNFFMEFDVCFYPSELTFEVRPRQKSP